MKKMIALLALAFFGMTATCGMTFAAEANNGMATANEQALQDPATHQQKKAPLQSRPTSSNICWRFQGK